MAAKQTSTVLGRFVEHQECFNPLPTADAQWAIQNPKDAAALCVVAIKGRNISKTVKKRTYWILRPVTPRPAESCPFKADDTFLNKKQASVKVAYRSENFVGWFAGKVEEDVSDTLLQPFALTQKAYDSEIITDLGGEDVAEVTLAEIWRPMERQANGGEGMLLTNGYANIFYVRDVNGVLRAVYVYWRGGGWYVCAYVLGDGRWPDAGRVFSRNS